MTVSLIKLSDVTTFIMTAATQEDLNRIYDTAKIRAEHLRAVRAAGVVVGSEVTIVNISPKSLSGLTGTVKSIDGKHATVTLDAASTRKAARARTKHTARIPFDAESYDMGGIPLTCCETAD